MRLPLEISPDALRRKLEAGERLRFIDIRERDERDDTEFDGTHGMAAESIPMFRLPHALERLKKPEGGSLVLLCSNGTRSLRAAAWLRRNGVPEAQSLSGGLKEWAGRNESAAPRSG